MAKYKIIALFGKSGAGKDTIQNWIVSNHNNKFNKIVSFTTRPKRDYEVEGKDYNFLQYDTLPNQKDILESTVFRGWFYGTSVNNLSEERINIGVFNLKGVLSLIRNPDVEVLPVYVYASKKTRIYRCLEREQNPDVVEICRRFLADEEDYSNTLVFDYVLFDNNSYNNDYYGILNLPEVKDFIEDEKD